MSVELKDNRIQVKAALDDAVISWLYEAAGEIESQTKRNSRVDTGRTKNTFTYAVDESKGEAMIGSNFENAIWEEFGTGEYALHGDGRKGGWFYKDAKGEGHFTHGKTPNRALQRAFDSLKSKAKKRLADILKERMGD